jgi:hypothetical protein
MALTAKIYSANDYDSIAEAERDGAFKVLQLHGSYAEIDDNKLVDALRALCFESKRDNPVIILENEGILVNVFHPSLKAPNVVRIIELSEYKRALYNSNTLLYGFDTVDPTHRPTLAKDIKTQIAENEALL